MREYLDFNGFIIKDSTWNKIRFEVTSNGTDFCDISLVISTVSVLFVTSNLLPFMIS